MTVYRPCGANQNVDRRERMILIVARLSANEETEGPLRVASRRLDLACLWMWAVGRVRPGGEGSQIALGAGKALARWTEGQDRLWIQPATRLRSFDISQSYVRRFNFRGFHDDVARTLSQVSRLADRPEERNQRRFVGR